MIKFSPISNFCQKTDRIIKLSKTTKMTLGLMTIHIQLPGCVSLKEKRSRLKPLLYRLHREFNISIAEVDYQDTWQDALLAVAFVSNNHRHTQKSLLAVCDWIEQNWPDVAVIEEKTEFF